MSKILGDCPICDGHIIQRENSYGCTNANWQHDDHFDELQNTGCRYSIHKESLKRYGKRKVSATDIQKLFKNGFFTAKLRSRFKKEYYKYVMVNDEYGIEVDFNTEVEEKDIK